MGAEARPEESSPPEANRRKKSKLGTAFSILILVLGIAFAGNLFLSYQSNQKAQTNLYAWTEQLQKDNPSVEFGSFSAALTHDWHGSLFKYRGKYISPTGQPIAIEFNHRGGALGRSGQLVLSSEGRSITWPIEDIERGRKVDLKAEFPEAFR